MMFSFWQKQKNWILDGLMIVAGSILFGLSVSVFAAPNQIAPGGFTGLSTLLNYLFQTPHWFGNGIDKCTGHSLGNVCDWL